MKNIRINLLLLVVVSLSLFSCKEDNLVNPISEANQILISKMKEVTDSVISNTNVPGIVALVVDHKKGIDWLYGSGVGNLITKTPINTNHIFRVGSNTKTFVITVLLQLAEEGKVSLDDKLSKFFPQYPKADSVNLIMLCNMTSGIFNYTDDESFWTAVENNPTRAWNPTELVEIGFSKEYYFSPGTNWHYSNTNTILVGMIIEKVTGNTLQNEIRKRIINPLNFTDTDFLTSGLSLPPNHSRGYYYGEYDPGADATETLDISWGWAAGSAYSTPRELQKYVETLVGGGLLKDSLQFRRFNSDFFKMTPTLGYGLGILQRGTFYGHNGALAGFTSSMYHSRDKSATVIIYYNCYLSDHPDQLFHRFMEILYGGNF
jgi:D-alanyl-D-alanine carboxypeptidase